MTYDFEHQKKLKKYIYFTAFPAGFKKTPVRNSSVLKICDEEHVCYSSSHHL